jgi:uncharacterized protein (DUF2267 family)
MRSRPASFVRRFFTGPWHNGTMSTKTIASFESATADAYQWLNEIGGILGDEDRHFALQLLRGVLYALRDRLTIDQSAHLSAQLPMLIRGIYFENWNPQPLPSRDRTVEEFIDHVRPVMTGYHGTDLVEDVSAVFEVLRRHVSWGEADKIATMLPHAISTLWKLSGP